MKTVLQHIFHLKRAYARLPFFEFLRDDGFSAEERLSFFPCMAPFILSFGDFNRHVLRVEPTTDPHQMMLNAHSYEDDHHWPWYLEDYTKLGHDAWTPAPSDVMRSLWSDASIQSRMLTPRLSHLVWSSTPAVRLALVEAIEETGNVLFALTAQLATKVRETSGVDLRYCGDFHFQRESGHAMNNDHAELAGVQLTPQEQLDAFAKVDEVFRLFTDWTQELLGYSLQFVEQGAPLPSENATAAVN